MSSIVTQAVTGTFLSLYIICIAIPSFVLNGLIVLTLVTRKALHTPANLISAHLCIVGLIVAVFYSPLTISSFITVMTTCTCNVLYYHWLIGHVFHFSIYPLNILLLTVSYFVILKFSSVVLTFTKVIVSLIIIWIVSTIGHIPILFITPQNTFTDCCETVCLNETASCNETIFKTFTPHTFTTNGRIYYNLRVQLLIIIPSVLVFITSAAAYYIYKKRMIKKNSDLQVRMLLLPVLMTFSVAVFILGQDVVNWQPSQVNEPSLPGIFVFVVMGLVWDSNGVYFALLILYFNVNIRRSCFKMVTENYRKLVTNVNNYQQHPDNNTTLTTNNNSALTTNNNSALTANNSTTILLKTVE